PRWEWKPRSVISASQATCSDSPVFVFSIVTASTSPSPWISRTSQGVKIRTRPSPSSARASLTDDSSARKLSLRWTRAIGCRAVAADDHARAVTEDVLLAHEVVHALARPVFDALDPELARLEGTVARRNDQRP